MTKDNAELKTRVLSNAAQLQRYQTLMSENTHLRSLLDAREKHQGTAIMAEILYSGRDPFSQKIVIDKGSQHQVKNGQAVIDERGVVGQITRVYPLVSDVTLLTDKDQAVPIQVARNGLRAILFGYGRGNPPELRFIPINADIQPGDELVTSGIDGTYPSGLPVATVKSIDRNAALAFAKVSCAPSAGIDHSRHLLVLTEISTAPAKPEAEETPEAVAAGKIKYVGLSEVDIQDIERARKILPIVSVQNLYNLGNRKWESVLDYTAKEDIAFIPWYPLASGPHKLQDSIGRIAAKYKATVAQISLAWLLKRSENILLIPGTSSLEHLKENMRSGKINLADEDFQTLSHNV